MESQAGRISLALNRCVEAVVAILMLALIVDVWFGVIDRYWFHWQLPWPEVLARYLMIWAAMLAVSCGVARREHIGLTSFLMTLPAGLRRAVLIVVDLLALALFAYVFWFGIGFAESGAKRQAMIFGATLEPFFWAIPAAAFLACVQLLMVLVRDRGLQLDRLHMDQTAEAGA